jgi:toxin-antitoxin system PIN domain toxin
MILPDLNLLLYAHNPFCAQHERASEWWESVLNGDEIVGLPHEVTLGFVRIATHPRLGKAAVPLAAAKSVVLGWLSLRGTRVLLPKEDHTARVSELMEQAGASGALASDASLAVHAIVHRATLCTNDGDFARFPGLDWTNPLRERRPAGHV